MLIKQETRDFWEKALEHFRNSEQLSAKGQWQQAADKATLSVLLAARAAEEIARELKMNDLSVMASNAFYSWNERTNKGKHYAPAETFEWAGRILQQLSKEMPQDTLPPLR